MEQAMYREKAKYYDLIYHEKDYEAESEKLKEIIEKYTESDGRKLLEAACGTGKHLQFLAEDFDCTGFDINDGVLEIARERVPDVDFFQADMTDFSLDEKFDVITCLFSSIGYVKTLENLQKTFRNFYEHLEEGGLVVVEPWPGPEEYEEGSPWLDTYQGDDLKLARASVSEVNGRISTVDFHWLVAKRGEGVTHFTDKHELGLFTKKETLDAMKKAGFSANFLDGKGLWQHVRGLYLGVK